jgi:hypothetical protein
LHFIESGTSKKTEVAEKGGVVAIGDVKWSVENVAASLNLRFFAMSTMLATRMVERGRI